MDGKEKCDQNPPHSYLIPKVFKNKFSSKMPSFPTCFLNAYGFSILATFLIIHIYLNMYLWYG